ncbi:MAG: coenzyme hydrogenase subunit beta [Thermodesulfobacteriota bacterium]|nr:coenzyme hydrogenase subunit beta [Thermodesulfobacteriota bacterium]
MEKIQGLKDLRCLVLDKGLCSACGACIGGCPYLTAFRGKTLVLDECAVEHGRCFAACPVVSSDPSEIIRDLFGESRPVTGLGIYYSVLASRAVDQQIVAKAQGGGTVTALMAHSIDQGMIDCAILTGSSQDSDYPGGVIAETPDDVMACAGSNYIGAHSLSALRTAIDKGRQAIGIVGLPCQVLAIRKMVQTDLKQERLGTRIKFVVGLFCNWAFSAREFMDFLTQRYSLKDIKRIHIPPPPANRLDVETIGGIESVPLDEVRHLIQESCRHCQDMTSEFADISVGMFEGRPSWNTLIVRTDQGRQLIDRLVKQGILETEVFPQSNLAHLESACHRKKTRT